MKRKRIFLSMLAAALLCTLIFAAACDDFFNPMPNIPGLDPSERGWNDIYGGNYVQVTDEQQLAEAKAKFAEYGEAKLFDNYRYRMDVGGKVPEAGIDSNFEITMEGVVDRKKDDLYLVESTIDASMERKVEETYENVTFEVGKATLNGKIWQYKDGDDSYSLYDTTATGKDLINISMEKPLYVFNGKFKCIPEYEVAFVGNLSFEFTLNPNTLFNYLGNPKAVYTSGPNKYKLEFDRNGFFAGLVNTCYIYVRTNGEICMKCVWTDTSYEQKAEVDYRPTDSKPSLPNNISQFEPHGHFHTFSLEWSSNADYHWHDATCCENVHTSFTEHTFVNGVCTVCGVAEHVEHVHTFSIEWSYDDTHHWHDATCAHDVKDGYSAHVIDPNGKCFCGYSSGQQPPMSDYDWTDVYQGEYDEVTDNDERKAILSWIAAQSDSLFNSYRYRIEAIESESEKLKNQYSIMCLAEGIANLTDAEKYAIQSKICGYLNVFADGCGYGPIGSSSIEGTTWANNVSVSEGLWYRDDPVWFDTKTTGQSVINLGDESTLIDGKIELDGLHGPTWIVNLISIVVKPSEYIGRACDDTSFVYKTADGKYKVVINPDTTNYQAETETYYFVFDEAYGFCMKGVWTEFGGADITMEYRCTNDTVDMPSDLSSYEKITCQHTYAKAWSYDETSHWHESTCGHDVKKDLATHDLDENGICRVCGARFGFDYELIGDSYAIVGAGSWNGEDLVIPSEYRGLPVTAIGDGAFKSCENIRSISISENISKIGEAPFLYARKLETIRVDENNGTYYSKDNCLIEAASGTLVLGCHQSVIPSDGSVRAIGDYAFNCATKVKEIVVPEGVVSIGQWAFSEVSCLRISLPTSLETIGEGAFFGSSIVTITIPKNVTSIGERAFEMCLCLIEVINDGSSLNIKRGSEDYGYVAYNALVVKNGGSSEIVKQDDFLFYTYKDINYLVGYLGFETDLVLPDTYNGESYQIYNGVFYRNPDITTITIPDSVTAIGAYALSGCDNLQEIYYIGDIAGWCGIRGLYGLMSSFSKTLYVDGKKIEGELIIPQGVTTIGSCAFFNCNLTNVTIPDSVTEIGSSAFNYCYNLISVTIGNGVTSIGDEAFRCCYNLESITIGNSVSSIGFGAFYDCRNLASITIPSSMISIGEHAFGGCCNIVEVINYSSLNIEQGSWDYGYVAYNALVVKNGGSSEIVKQDDFLFYTYKDINYFVGYLGFETDLVLPDTYNGESYQINRNAFALSEKYSSITIPDSVTAIGDFAFCGCDRLKKVKIGKGIMSIGERIFEWCYDLQVVEFAGTMEQWGNVFGRDIGIDISNVTIVCSDGIFEKTESQLEIVFAEPLPENYRVAIIGSFNNWQIDYSWACRSDDGTTFTISLENLAGGICDYEYRIKVFENYVEGEFWNDANNNPYGIEIAGQQRMNLHLIIDVPCDGMTITLNDFFPEPHCGWPISLPTDENGHLICL